MNRGQFIAPARGVQALMGMSGRPRAMGTFEPCAARHAVPRPLLRFFFSGRGRIRTGWSKALLIKAGTWDEKYSS